MRDKKRSFWQAAFTVLFMLQLVPALAFSQTPFYQGKTITLIRGSTPGGVGERRVRAVIPYLSKYIPGNPTILIEFMPGAGGRKAANYMYHRARPDGLTLANIGSGLITNAVLGEAGVEYDLDKFIYLGTPNTGTHYIFLTSSKLGLTTLEKLRAHAGLRIVAHAVGHEIYLTGRLFAYMLDLKEPKFVTGFSDPEMVIALAQGEVDGRSQVAESIEITPGWIDKGVVDFHAILETPKVKKHPRFAQLPTLESFAKSAREQNVLLMHRAFRLVGTPYLFPPGTPRDRVEIVTEALRMTFRDPAFLKDFKTITGADATPLMAEEQDKAIKEIPRDREVIELFKKLAGGDPLPPR
jgi:tripartite-type tricarboxylate transporter receptor subunit TctC